MKAAIHNFDRLLQTGEIYEKLDTIAAEDTGELDIETPNETHDSLLDLQIPEFTPAQCAQLEEILDRDMLFEMALEDDSVDQALLASVITACITGIRNTSEIICDIRCAAHTLRPAVKDAFKDAALTLLIKSVKGVVRNLRTKKFIQEATEKGIQYVSPRLWCNTRWDSEFIMVSA